MKNLSTPLSNEELASFCMELSLLLRAGVGAADGLSLLAAESAPQHKELLLGLAGKMDTERISLSESLRECGDFPAYVCGLVEVGETAGRTEEALAALAQYYESRVRLDRRIRSALLYPVVMLLLMLVVIGVLLIKVLPIFNDVYASLGGSLSGVAGLLLSVGQALDTAMPVLWVLMAAAVLFVGAFALLPGFRAGLLRSWQKSRGDKGVARQINSARLAQALSMGLASGLPLDESVELAAGLMGDVKAAEERCHDCRRRLDTGEPLADALRNSGILPASQCRLLELGHKGGMLDEIMNKIALNLAEESEAALEDKVSRVEPALVLVCTLLVGLILLSVMLPLMNIMAAIG